MTELGDARLEAEEGRRLAGPAAETRGLAVPPWAQVVAVGRRPLAMAALVAAQAAVVRQRLEVALAQPRARLVAERQQRVAEAPTWTAVVVRLEAALEQELAVLGSTVALALEALEPGPVVLGWMGQAVLGSTVAREALAQMTEAVEPERVAPMVRAALESMEVPPL